MQKGFKLEYLLSLDIRSELFMRSSMIAKIELDQRINE
ncbi:Phage protein [Candidatus Arthromitus sp. SFB-mouse-NL]|nr:Phage protein [Candidatus Arthromitus sp. SFB-mouse-NL]